MDGVAQCHSSGFSEEVKDSLEWVYGESVGI